MKKTIWFLILVLVSCNSKDVFQQEFPLPIADYYFSANGNQTVFRIELKQPISDAIEMQNLYFRNQKATVKMISEDTFDVIFTKSDLILDADSTMESVNQPPIKETIPFQIKSNEAVLEYKHKGKTNYFLFSNVVEKSNQ